MSVTSPFFQFRIRQQFALSPSLTKNVREGVNRVLLETLMTYIPSLGGVLVSFSNVKLMSKSAALNWEFPDIHVDVEVDVVVFKPEMGHLLRGTIRTKGADYISLIVEDTWEAHVYLRDGDVEQAEGDEILFYVKKVLEHDKNVSLEGVLSAEEVEAK